MVFGATQFQRPPADARKWYDEDVPKDDHEYTISFLGITNLGDAQVSVLDAFARAVEVVGPRTRRASIVKQIILTALAIAVPVLLLVGLIVGWVTGTAGGGLIVLWVSVMIAVAGGFGSIGAYMGVGFAVRKIKSVGKKINEDDAREQIKKLTDARPKFDEDRAAFAAALSQKLSSQLVQQGCPAGYIPVTPDRSTWLPRHL